VAAAVTVEEIQKQQEALMPKGDLTPYAGKWVAIRDGEVVASDIDSQRLREHDDVRPDDVLAPVAHADQGYLIL